MSDERGFPLPAGSDAAVEYRALFLNHPDAVLALDREGRVTTANAGCERLWQAPAEDLRDSPFLSLVMPEDRPRAAEALEAVAEGESITLECGAARRDGRRAEVELTLVPCGSGVFVIAHDVTELRAAAAQLADREELFRRLVEDSSELFFYRQDAQGRLDYVSPAVADVLGYAPDELVGTKLSALIADRRPAGAEVDRRQQDNHGKGRPGVTTATVRHRDGHTLFLETVEAPVRRGDRVVGTQGLARDVTRQKKLEEQLLHEALHDPLTGLPNRALFLDRLDHTGRAASRNRGTLYSVLLVDVDEFKRINDRLGHELGDRVLVDIAARLQRCVRPGDTVCRMGGDEFTILLQDINEAGDATRVADRIRMELVSPFRFPPHELFVTTSIGIAVSGPEGDDPRDLLRNADTALYRAKQGGKARYEVFDRAMHESNLERLQLESDLRSAVRSGGLSVLYQPVVSLRTGQISSFEALVRWRHPSRGTLAAAEFVPVAEDTGLVAAIDRWVLREACRQLSAWQRQFGDRSPRISVNVSERELLSPDILEHVRRVLAETGAEASLLRLEISEQVFAADTGQVEQVLRDLRVMGVVVQVDHFGTGGSAVQSLRRLPVDALKVHRSMLQDSADPEVLRAIVGLAKALDLPVVAEGVETTEQMSSLRTMECDFAQGFFLSVPVDAEEARRMLARDLPV